MTARLCDILRLFVRQCTLLKKGLSALRLYAMHSGKKWWIRELVLYSTDILLLLILIMSLLAAKNKISRIMEIYLSTWWRKFCRFDYRKLPNYMQKICTFNNPSWNGNWLKWDSKLTFPYAQKNKENSAKNLERQSHALSHWKKK